MDVTLIIALLASLVTPVILRYVPLKGAQMAFVALGASAVIALVVGAVQGDFSHLDLSTPEKLLSLLAALYAIQQIAYSALKDRLHL